MRAGKAAAAPLGMLVWAAAAGGCVDFVREGLPQGLAEGISDSVVSVFGLFPGAWAGGS